MRHISYLTKGVCARQIDFDLDENNLIHNVSFMGGCHGNLKAIAKLCEGKDASEISKILEGNTCGYKTTSCADQFSKALNEAISQ